ncbi:MAG: helix-turn-helix domain-containing protein [Actinomycetota bacterium]|nr:helix-turn-helix domain-containing protein [Actinomycetota bacterium]
MEPVFQVMPALDAEEIAALEVDIAERGVVVPIVVDQHGRVLDGHHRRAIAARMGVDCPTEVRHVADDDEARSTALALNLARRHLTREQRRQLIAAEIAARPGDSDRAIARRFGCSPSTVGAVRREVSKLDTAPPAAAADAALTDEERQELARREDVIRKALNELDDSVLAAIHGGVHPALILAMMQRLLRDLPGPRLDDGRSIVEPVFRPQMDLLADLTADAGRS